MQPDALAVHEIDVALERLGLADGEVERRDLVAERRAQGVQRRPSGRRSRGRSG